MEDGRVVERGTHEQLMSAGGTYYKMVRRQMEFSREGNEDAAFEMESSA
jgi:ABC-type transport system involved in cytochrome bd biosynthesis fused ATPase/permease subunit